MATSFCWSPHRTSELVVKNKPTLWGVFFFVMFNITGCGTTEIAQNPSNTQTFETSNLEKGVIIASTKDLRDVQYVSGKGRLYYHSNGESERLGMEYVLNSEREIYSLKNRLGIPIADIQLEVDSILFVDRLQKKALKWHRDYPPAHIPGMIPPIRLYDVIHYPNWIDRAVSFEQSKTLVRAQIPDIGYLYLDASNYALGQLIYKNEWELEVRDRKSYKNSMIGRTFQLRNIDRTTQILIQLIELEWQTDGHIQELSIPTTFERINF